MHVPNMMLFVLPMSLDIRVGSLPTTAHLSHMLLLFVHIIAILSHCTHKHWFSIELANPGAPLSSLPRFFTALSVIPLNLFLWQKAATPGRSLSFRKCFPISNLPGMTTDSACAAGQVPLISYLIECYPRGHRTAGNTHAESPGTSSFKSQRFIAVIWPASCRDHDTLTAVQAYGYSYLPATFVRCTCHVLESLGVVDSRCSSTQYIYISLCVVVTPYD